MRILSMADCTLDGEMQRTLRAGFCNIITLYKPESLDVVLKPDRLYTIT